MAKKDPAIVAMEKEIDVEIVRSDLRKERAPQAIWSLLSVIDNGHFKDMMEGERVQFRHGNHTQIISLPLRCFLSNDKKFAGGPVDLSRALDTQAMALDWLNRCQDYRGFEALLPLWHRDKITLRLEGNRLLCEDTEPGDPYDAYNATIGDEGTPIEDQRHEISVQALAPHLTRSVQRIGKDSYTVVPTPEMIREFSKAVPESGWSLPEEWDFGDFRLGEFKRIYIAIRALALIWLVARVVSWHKKVYMISGICQLEFSVVKNLIHRATEISCPAVDAVCELLTFGSLGILVPDATLQPLLVTETNQCFIAPILLLHTAPENNLCGLVNRVPRYRAIYSKLSNEKETLMFREARMRLEALGLEVNSGEIDGTNIDLAITEHATKACLCVELKWFISPTSIGECHLRGLELAVGIRQAKKISLARSALQPSLVRLTNIVKTYDFLAIVASMNWIGNSEHQDPDVPMVKFRHLLEKLEAFGVIGTIQWLRNRDYLPAKDVDFECFELDVKCGRWESKWGGLRRIE